MCLLAPPTELSRGPLCTHCTHEISAPNRRRSGWLVLLRCKAELKHGEGRDILTFGSTKLWNDLLAQGWSTSCT
jgi:hypothetical protein